MKIKIAVADDHPLVLTGLQHLLNNCEDMEVTGKYHNGEELLKGLQNDQPDVLLLDIQMPGQTGDQLGEIISKRYPKVRMLALTNLDNVYYIKTMMRNGVLGYILKTTEESTLLEGIRKVYSGEQYLEPLLQQMLMKDLLRTKKQQSMAPTLSRREKEILQLIAADMTSQQIADKLFLSKRTVDSHRARLLVKLDCKNVAALVKKVVEMGMVE